jgi:hypothetical protein
MIPKDSWLRPTPYINNPLAVEVDGDDIIITVPVNDYNTSTRKYEQVGTKQTKASIRPLTMSDREYAKTLRRIDREARETIKGLLESGS